MHIRRALITESDDGYHLDRQLWVQAEKEDALLAECMNCGRLDRPLFHPIDAESPVPLYAVLNGLFCCQPCIRKGDVFLAGV